MTTRAMHIPASIMRNPLALSALIASTANAIILTASVYLLKDPAVASGVTIFTAPFCGMLGQEVSRGLCSGTTPNITLNRAAGITAALLPSAIVLASTFVRN